MKLTIGHLYPELLNLYGDRGNIICMVQRLKWRGIDAEVKEFDLNDKIDFSKLDIVLLGGGSDREQLLVCNRLKRIKKDFIDYVEQGGVVLAICGGYQLFGQYYISADNEKIEGLKFFDYYTTTGSNGTRCIGNIAIRCNLDGHEITAVGFENHGGQTCNVATPLGKVISGYGNSFDSGYEGFYNGSVLGTYMHGPLFPKNPEIVDFVIYKSLKKNHPDVQLEDLIQLDDTLEQKAKEAMLKRLQVQ